MTQLIPRSNTLSNLLKLLAATALIPSFICGRLFYESYFKWRSLFEDGRYFNPETGVVSHDSGFVWGLLSLAFLLMAIALWLYARKFTERDKLASLID
jgi:hypothetical protein